MVFDNWPMLLLGRLFDRKTGFVAYRKKGLDILVDHHGGDQCGTRLCIATDMYRKYLPHFKLPSSIRVLDLGGNGGGFPLMLRIEGMDLARVVSVEMNPLTYRRLVLNLTTNLGPSAVAINAAVCGMPQGSEIRIKPSRGGTNESMYKNQAGNVDEYVAVPTITLQALYDQYFKSEVLDIVKIDIEGAEFELFDSSPDELLQKMRYLIMEIHPMGDSALAKMQALLARLDSLGFKDITFGETSGMGLRPEVRAFAGPAAEAVSPTRAA